MAIIFNGRDVVLHFKEEPFNRAVVQYRIEYECGYSTVVHYVDALNDQGTDEDGNSLYRDVLTYAENEAAGLTRSPTVTMFTQDANLKWSPGIEIPAINPISVFDNAPSVVPTVDGVIIAVTPPADRDLEGYIAWVSKDATFPLNATTERYRGKATQFPIPLPDRSKYYVRVAPFDAFGVDTFAAWPAIEAQRNLIPGINTYPIIQRIDGVAEAALKAMTAGDKAYRGYRDETKVIVDELRFDVLADGTNWQTAINLITQTQGNLQTAILDEQTTRISDILAATDSINVMGSMVGANEAAVLLEKNTRTTNEEAFASQLEEQQADIATAKAGIIAERLAWSTALASQTTIFNQQLSTFNTNLTALVTSKTQTLTDKDNQLASQISQISARAEDAHARITSVNQAAIDRNAATALSVTTLQSNLNGTNNSLALVQQSMSPASNRLGNVEAQWGFSVQAGNVVAGMKALANSGGISQIVFQAGAIAFRNHENGINYPLVEIVGGQMRIPNAMIGNANITSANIQYLGVGTNNLAINAVNDIYYVERTALVLGTNAHVNVLSHTFYAEVDCEVIVDMSGSQGFPSGDRRWEFGIYCDGSQMRPIFGGQKTEDVPNGKAKRRVGAGWHTVHTTWLGESSAVRLAFLSMIITVMKR